MQGEEQNNWLRKGIPKSGAVNINSASVIGVLLNERSDSERSTGADSSKFDVRHKGIFVDCFLQSCL